MAENEVFREWAVVELFGHQRLIGVVTEQTIAGQGFIRVDVPANKTQAAFTRLLGAGAIYAINPVSEEIAMAYVNSLNQAPIQAYELRQLTAPQPVIDHDEDDDDDDDDGKDHDF